MKNLNLLFVCLAVALASCSNNEDEQYSCDESTNEWIVSNLDEIRTMDRASWAAIPSETTRHAAYGVFSSDQKYNFWLDKFAEMQELGWNESELAHIKLLRDFITSVPNYFDDIVDVDVEDAVDLFLYKWKEYAKDVLGWNDHMLYSMIATGESMISREGNFVSDETLMTLDAAETGNQSDCICSVVDDWCNFVLSADAKKFKCTSGSCNTKENCGTLWKKTCDGSCIWYD
jgi:hypothetical protein